MKGATKILHTVKNLGGSIEPMGDNLRVLLPADCSPKLKDAIRKHKRELIDLLETQNVTLREGKDPWLHVARQILMAEFDDADGSTINALVIGLRGVNNPICKRALRHLGKGHESGNSK